MTGVGWLIVLPSPKFHAYVMGCVALIGCAVAVKVTVL